MSLKAKAVSGIKWQAVEVVGRQLLSLGIFTTLARMLEPSQFGVIAMVGFYISIVSLFAQMGLGTALVQRAEVSDQHLHTAFWFMLGCSSMLCAISMVFAPEIAWLFDDPQLTSVVRWCALMLPLGALTAVHGAQFSRDLEFGRPAIRTLLANLVGGVVGIVLAFMGYGVWALVFQQLTASAAGTIFVWSVSKYSPRFVFSVAHLRDLLSTGGAVFLTSILWLVSSRAEFFLIGRFLGSSTAGYYTVASKLPEMARIGFSQPVTAISMPSISRLQSDRPRLIQAVYEGMIVVAVVSFPLALGMASSASLAIPVLFGDQWYASIPMLQLLSIYALVYFLQLLYHPLLFASGKAQDYLFFNVVQAVGALLACVIGKYVGIHGLILCLIASATISGLLTFRFLSRKLGLRWSSFWSPCIAPAVASILMGVLVALTCKLSPLVGLYAAFVASIAVGVLSYCFFLWLIRPSYLKLIFSLMFRRGRSVVQPA